METHTMKNEYDIQAETFLKKHGIKFHASYITHDSMDWDDKNTTRDIWRLSLTRGRKRYSTRFGQSIAECGKEPRAYSLLTCITKNDPGTLSDFCSEFGYDTDSRRAEKTYKAVLKDWKRVEAFFSPEEIAELQEVQ